MTAPALYIKLAYALEARGIDPYTWVDAFEKNAQAAVLARPMAGIGSLSKSIAGGFKNFLEGAKGMARRVRDAAFKAPPPVAGPVNYNRQAWARQQLTGMPTSIYGRASLYGVRPIRERSIVGSAPKGLYATTPAQRARRAITHNPVLHPDMQVVGGTVYARPRSPFEFQAQPDVFAGLKQSSAKIAAALYSRYSYRHPLYA